MKYVKINERTAQAERTAFLKGVAFGHTTAWLETFAERSQVPFEVLADGLGGLLHTAASGQVLGPGNPVPELRRAPTTGAKGHAKVEVADSAPRQAQVKATAGVRKYWAKMSKKQRAAEMQRRVQLGIERRAKEAKRAA